MTGISDHYQVYYADKLWNLLPAVYRAEDTDQFGANGPLRELVNRIGAQAANLRRSIDRMWEDQSIETCDDWVIAYIGDLLNTNLVAGLDSRGQRIDVAKTIYYRRRKGTVALLEELAFDITGWDAKVVEFFRRMGRTRHLLDPAIGVSLCPGGDAGQLQIAEGLVGARTHTGIGGFADLRNVYGASKAGSAFDEYFHMADIRAGLGDFGWYNIPHLGVFLWRLNAYPVGPVTPVAVAGCPGWYCFDPTGRDIPLFGQQRETASFGSSWVSPSETQLPTPISQALLDADTRAAAQGKPAALYSQALAVYLAETDPPDNFLIPAGDLVLRPTRGRFAYMASPPPAAELVASYNYGFPSDIGAGPYDRRIDGLAIDTPAPPLAVAGGGAALAGAGAVPESGTLTIGDCLTYDGIAAVAVAGALTLRAANRQRPLLRLGSPTAPWLISGAAGSTLTLDGVFVSGGDVVLQGNFDKVTLSCCTLDPGNPAAAGAPSVGAFAAAADGHPLVPTRLWIEATIGTLTVDRCVLAAIRTRNGGLVETVTITNSILQAIPTGGTGAIEADDIKDPERLEARLLQAMEAGSIDAVANKLLARQPQNFAASLGLSASPPPSVLSPPSAASVAALVHWLAPLVAGPSLYDLITFRQVPLSAASKSLLASTPRNAPAAPALNRSLLEDAFPLELADAALGFGDGTVTLSRCTVLGRVVAHRIEASECILSDLAQIDDTQNGCVRFSAWADGSVLPRKYESVRITPQAPLFTSVAFGRPGYGQLTALVDAAILPETGVSTAPPNSISTGAVDGSEMGAYARDKNPIKQRGLLIKYQEYMPAGLVPVIVYAT